MKKWIFLSIEGIIYGSFMVLDILIPAGADVSNYLKYTGILLCFLYVLFFASRLSEREDLGRVRLILLFTLISDTFLLLIHNYAIGMTSFVVAQLLHWYRLRDGKPQKNGYIVGIGVLTLIILSIMKVPMDYVLVVAVFYFLCMVRNAGYAVVHRENYLYSIGLLLFLCCDINVGLNNLSSYIEVSGAMEYFVSNVVSVAMWFFYLPSQVLIALSVKQGKSFRYRN